MPTDSRPLAGRVRALLQAKSPPTREVPMFGGLSFMVNEKMVVSVRADSGLLVRADPDRSRELLARAGARPAETGAGRAMGPSWIYVAEQVLVSTDELAFWIDVALQYNAQVAQSTRPADLRAS